MSANALFKSSVADLPQRQLRIHLAILWMQPWREMMVTRRAAPL